MKRITSTLDFCPMVATAFFFLGRDDQGIHLGSLDSKEHHLILRESSSMAYVEPAYLLFGRNGALMAQRFDAKRTQTLGEPIRIADSLEATSGFGYSFSVSNNESQAASRLETMVWRHSGPQMASA